MKSTFITLLLVGAIFSQAVKHTRYDNDVTVNLKQYADENTRIRKDLDIQIARKKELVIEGNHHNANMKKVTGYVDAWSDDIKATQKAVSEFETNAKKTRTQWTEVKKTQLPYKGPVTPPKPAAKKGADAKKAPKPAAKPAAKAPKPAAKPAAKKPAPAVAKKAAKPAPKAAPKKDDAPKQRKGVAKMAMKAAAKQRKGAKGKIAAKAKVAAKGKEVTKDDAKKAAAALAKKSADKDKKAKKDSRRRLQAVQDQKTLESVNKKYREQVDELEHNINEVIVKIKEVYRKAEKDDNDAEVLQGKQDKTMEDLKTFLKHIMEYIQWTQTTMANYAKLFHTRPDNVFADKARRLIQKIKEVL